MENDFRSQLQEQNISTARNKLKTVQVNNGRLCNLACLHCHVEAGPKRTELMDEKTSRRVIELIQNSHGIESLDITGGAPEMNPHFRWMIIEAKKLGLHAIDRCNLTIFFEEGYGDLPHFLAKHNIHIIASLPCYSSANVDKQRGSGTFDKSIQALQILNSLGYGLPNSALQLDLVYNPVGAELPGSQADLEIAYKERLYEDFGIHFHRLYTITNMPIKRFERQLKKWGKLEEYMNLLAENFNPHAARHIMCKELISIDYLGNLYDCDFNQMLGLKVIQPRKSIWSLSSFDELSHDDIAFGRHCYGCTAGAGSSCGGSLT